MSTKYILPSQYRPLDGSNYAEWVTPMISLLESHSVWRHALNQRRRPAEVVAGTGPAAIVTNQKDIDTWEDADDCARGIITANVSQAIQHTLIHTMDGNMTNRLYGTSAECWDYLKTTYGTTRGLTSIMVHRKVVRYDFDDTPFAKQLDTLDEFRSKLVGTPYAISDEVFAALILHSLPESYSTIVQTLITQASTNAITLADVRNAMYAE